jgi:beta-galactosidase
MERGHLNRNFPAHVVGVIVLLATGLPATAQAKPTNEVVVINARTAAPAPEPLPFAIGGASPTSHSLSANNRYLLRDGQPWFPIMGEFHYARYPEEQWEQEILKIKAAGVQVISTYIFWIYHEEIEGQFDWTGRRDLRHFVELCAKRGMYVWIRIGPWDHGEVRNGGFPDWLLQKTRTRQNDSAYLKYVARFDSAIGEQLKGLFWKDGGPIIGVQLENEYSARGPGKGEEHILRLRQLAREAGLDAPFYNVTAWDGAAIPSHDILPMFSGYADGFWWRSLDDLPPSPNFFFTRIRCEENVAEDLTSKHPDIDALDYRYPFLTAEMGGGMELSYHRRPSITADDTASMELVKLGSGATSYGYYMFHGGTNPEGKLTSLQESQATGYPNDLPVKSYDFQAPIGEFGQENPSFNVLKLFHLFLGDFGAQLAAMTPYFPEKLPTSKHDTSTPRVAARLQGGSGFLFINNYQRTYPLPERKDFQVRLNLPAETVNIPEQPTSVPSGAYMISPVNVKVGAVKLRYATAQLLCRLTESSTYVFLAWPGIPAEFAFKDEQETTIEAPGARIRRSGAVIYVDQLVPGTNVAIKLRTKAGGKADIIVLSREQALNVWKTTLAGKERLILSSNELYTDGNKLILTSDSPQIRAGFFPPLDRDATGFNKTGNDGIFSMYETDLPPATITAKIEKLSEPGADPPLKMGKEVVLAPEESAFDTAARWRIQLPETMKNSAGAFLRIEYQGDIGRVYVHGKLLTDNFYNGSAWIIGLDRIAGEERTDSLELRVLPLQDHAPIYLPKGARPAGSAGGVANLKDVRVVPRYRAVMDVEP